MTALAIKDGAGADRQLAVVDDGTGVLTTVHVEQTAQRTALLAAFSPLATAALQTSNTNAIVAAVQATSTATQPVSIANLPLPTGAATAGNQTTANNSLAAIQASVGGTLKVDTVVQASSTSRSGTITAGGTAQVLMAANSTRRGFVIQNNSSAALYINGLGTATSDGQSLTIAAGALYETSVQHTGVGAVSILGATTGQAFYAREF